MKSYIAEFIGATFMIILNNGVVANALLKKTKGNGSGWIAISFGSAMAVLFAIILTRKISGAHLNPAVTIAMFASGNIGFSQSVMYVISQMLGGMFAAFILWIFYRHHFDEEENQSIKQSCFYTSPSFQGKYMSNCFSEIVATCVLVLVIISVGKYDGIINDLAPIFIASAIFGIALSLGGTSGFALNPARDFGPRLMYNILPIKNKGKVDFRYSFVPLLAPVAGGLLAVLISKILYGT